MKRLTQEPILNVDAECNEFGLYGVSTNDDVTSLAMKDMSECQMNQRLVPCAACQRWFLGLLLLLAGLLLPSMTMASSLPPELSHALTQLAEAHGFSGKFKQTIRFSDGTMQTYQGDMAVLQPGRFRWHYTQPYEQLFVSDGHVIWHYEPDLMQVQILKRVQDVDPVVMRLLDGSLGFGSIILLENGNEANGSMHRYHVRIGAKKKVWLGLSEHQLVYVESVDALGNHNRIRLLHMTQHPPAAATFVFKIPDGVDVLPFKDELK